jgi:inhibitor of KinA sporulation pathway (predicted exonuclease)
MAQALALLHLPLTGTHHRGGDDAYNIAQIATVIFQQRGREIFGA